MIKVYNSLTRKKEALVVEGNKISMYVCGITPYDDCHIGHARCYIVYDIIHRYFEYRNYDVLYIQNFTDIDDKIINKARQENTTITVISNRYIEKYFEVMDKLNIKRADIYPKVSEHIPDIISVISKLIEKGFGYCVDGDVYFSVDKFPDYGKLSGRDKNNMLAGARVDVDEKKTNPLDFALWKKAKEDEPYFDSPWGKGRPGWHIECSVMSMKHLGETFTIHGGAKELIFPHHENEIAQSEAYTGKSPFAKYWIHNGLVVVGSQKMSKSLKNFITIEEITKKYSASTIRLYFLSTHYRSPMDFDEKDLNSCKIAFSKLNNTKQRLEELLQNKIIYEIDDVYINNEFYKKVSQYKEKFIESMDDDFNTAVALSCLFELSTEINKFIDANQNKIDDNILKLISFSYITFIELCNVFGFFEKTKDYYTFDIDINILKNLLREYLKEDVENFKDAISIINKLIEIRNNFRKEKKYKDADDIRNKLKEINILLEDKQDKTTAKVKRY